MYKDENGIPQKKFHFELKYDTFVGKPKQEVIKQFEETYTTDGVVRWVKSDNVVPEDFLYDFRDLNLIPTEFIQISLDAKNVDMEKHVGEYIQSMKDFKKNDPEGWAEQQAEMMFEASAAMGPGEEMVNIFTGDTFTTR